MIVGERAPAVDRDEPPSLAALLARPAWHRDASCREHVDWSWFPGPHDKWRHLLNVCAQCLVVDECREAGQSEAFGIWGGELSTRRGVVPRAAFNARDVDGAARAS